MNIDPVFHLVFTSTFTHDYTKQDIIDIFGDFQDKNKSENITGLMVCYGKDLIQLIEGPEKNVWKLWARLLLDDRHNNLSCIKTGNTLTRLFPNTPMRYEIILDVLKHATHSQTYNTVDKMYEISDIFRDFVRDHSNGE